MKLKSNFMNFHKNSFSFNKLVHDIKYGSKFCDEYLIKCKKKYFLAVHCSVIGFTQQQI
jgi:hypothetical protein